MQDGYYRHRQLYENVISHPPIRHHGTSPPPHYIASTVYFFVSTIIVTMIASLWIAYAIIVLIYSIATESNILYIVQSIIIGVAGIVLLMSGVIGIMAAQHGSGKMTLIYIMGLVSVFIITIAALILSIMIYMSKETKNHRDRFTGGLIGASLVLSAFVLFCCYGLCMTFPMIHLSVLSNRNENMMRTTNKDRSNIDDDNDDNNHLNHDDQNLRYSYLLFHRSRRRAQDRSTEGRPRDIPYYQQYGTIDSNHDNNLNNNNNNLNNDSRRK